MELRNIDKAFSLIIEYKEEKARLEALEHFEKQIPKTDSFNEKLNERIKEIHGNIISLEFEIKSL
ncbi:MAG: hypothetical protein HUJ88_02265 [Fusobacterium necrophorum]|nr:hypothetical protein [Fusobacterium necrophorum]